MKPEEKNKTDLPTNSKWQIGLVLWQKVARRETERSAASAKRAVRDGYSFQFNRACAPSLEPDCVRFPKFCWNLEGVQNRRFWHAFGDFRRETKVTRGLGRSAQIRGRRSSQLRINPPGCRAERLHGGSRDSRSCKIPPLVAAGTQKETAQLLTAPSLWCLCIGKLSD